MAIIRKYIRAGFYSAPISRTIATEAEAPMLLAPASILESRRRMRSSG
jgi:hypothetical protein